jgi:hypothetical protein
MIYDMIAYDDYDYITKMTSNRFDILIYSHSPRFSNGIYRNPYFDKDHSGGWAKMITRKCWVFLSQRWPQQKQVGPMVPPLTWHSLTSYSQWNKQNMKLGMVHFWLSNYAKAKCFMSGPMSNYIWLVVYLPLWEKKISWGYYSQYMEK